MLMIILFVIKQKAKKMCQTQKVKVFMIRSNYIQSSWSRVSYPYNFNEMGIYVPPTEGGGHIVFGADPVGVRLASFPCVIF